MKLKEAKTSDEELKPFAAQAEKFYGTMPSLRGKPLKEISKDQIEAALFSGFERDERICLIYRAAMLNKVDDSQKRKAASPAESSISPKEPKTEWILAFSRDAFVRFVSLSLPVRVKVQIFSYFEDLCMTSGQSVDNVVL